MLWTVWLVIAAGPPTGTLPPGAIARLGDARLNQGHSATSVVFSGDGSTLLSGSHSPCYARGLTVWDVRTGCPLREGVCASEEFLCAFAPHPSKGLVLWADAASLALWDIEAGKAVWKVPAKAHAVAWGRGGRWALTK